jgi:hypothetical protein
MDKRLEEHLEHMRQLSARVAQIHEQLAQNTELLTRDHDHQLGAPGQEARQLRTWSEAESVEPTDGRHRRSPRAHAADGRRSRRRGRR